MQLTPYPDINSFLDTLLLQLKTILGERLIGVSLFGSLVWGDFEYGSSDIDLLVVTSSDITNHEFDKLDDMQQELAKTSTHAKEGMIEIAYVSENALQTFKTQRSQIAIIGPGKPFHITDAGKDWLMNWYLVQEKALTLFGPPPKTLIVPTTREEFIQAVRDHANAWRNWTDGLHGRPGQAYAILTLCRAYYTSKMASRRLKKEQLSGLQKHFLNGQLSSRMLLSGGRIGATTKLMLKKRCLKQSNLSISYSTTLLIRMLEIIGNCPTN